MSHYSYLMNIWDSDRMIQILSGICNSRLKKTIIRKRSKVVALLDSISYLVGRSELTWSFLPAYR